jgi:hypothetical protein
MEIVLIGTPRASAKLDGREEKTRVETKTDFFSRNFVSRNLPPKIVKKLYQNYFSQKMIVFAKNIPSIFASIFAKLFAKAVVIL